MGMFSHIAADAASRRYAGFFTGVESCLRPWRRASDKVRDEVSPIWTHGTANAGLFLRGDAFPAELGRHRAGEGGGGWTAQPRGDSAAGAGTGDQSPRNGARLWVERDAVWLVVAEAAAGQDDRAD